MTKLLYIEASPRGRDSDSIHIAEGYLAELKKQSSALVIDRINLWQEELPAFDGDRAAAKMNILTGQCCVGVRKTAWDEVVEVSHRFTSADRYVFAVPMWNAGIPYRLKQYIDIVHQPGLTFGLKPESGFFGLLKNRHATLILTAGAYSDQHSCVDFGADYQSTYLRFWLNQAGITNIDEIRFQPTLLSTDPVGDLARAKHLAAELAQSHGCV